MSGRRIERTFRAAPGTGPRPCRKAGIPVKLLVLATVLSGFPLSGPADPPRQAAGLRRVRSIDLGPIGPLDGAGLAYLGSSERFLVFRRGPGRSASGELRSDSFSPRGARTGSGRLAVNAGNPVNAAFDRRTGQVLFFSSDSRSLWGLRADQHGNLAPETLRPYDIASLALNDPLGLATDPEGRMYIFDRRPPRLIQAEFVGGLGVHLRSVAPLPPGGVSEFLDIAYDPASGHLFALAAGAPRLVEMTVSGRSIAAYDLSAFLRGTPRSLAFAPSGDATDEASEQSLYVVEVTERRPSGPAEGRITELSLANMSASGDPPATVIADLVRTIHTCQFSPPSPDPAGIAYHPPTNRLLIADCEVDEMDLFEGFNVFEVDAAGTLVRTGSTTSFSNEPTGIAYDPGTRRFFISDDDTERIYLLDPGADGLPFTVDDSVTSFRVDPVGSQDPEDVAFDSWRGALFWVDGLNNEVYRAEPGPNGLFDGPPPGGDDLVTSFDTEAFGVLDPEGICFNTDNGHLFIVGFRRYRIAETDGEGRLLRVIDASATGAEASAGLAYAPSSILPGTMDLYLAARGADNGEDPSENDGEVYELSFPLFVEPNLPPTVNAGPDQEIQLPQAADLEGTAVDDGLPSPPGAVTFVWSQVEGPGTVTFADATSAQTTASFSCSGTYVFCLTGSDGELSSDDTVTVTVSDAASPAAVRVDLNGDGQEDILWRYYGTGGDNVVWYLANTAALGQPHQMAARSTSGPSAKSMVLRRMSETINDRRAARLESKESRDVMRAMKRASARGPVFSDPRAVGKASGMPGGLGSPAIYSDARQVALKPGASVLAGPTAQIAATGVLGLDALPSVPDVNWKIAGTGDFDNDAMVDVLWRYDGTGGDIVVWFMDGTTVTGIASLGQVTDLNWQIVGTGDFDGDTQVDILWRYNGTGGDIVVWFMDGTTVTEMASLGSVTDLNWRIVGTGDFDNDTLADVLWRYNGPGGDNVVWFMDGTTVTGMASLGSVTDLNWQIVGTGDFDNDTFVDILWRYNGPGGDNIIWFMNGTTVTGMAGLSPVEDLDWLIVNR